MEERTLAKLVEIKGNEVAIASAVIDRIKKINAAMKAAKEAETDLKAAFLKVMEEYKIERIDNPEAGLSIIRFPESETVVFDTDAFSVEMPDLYEDYCTKKRKTRSYVKISVKEPQNAGSAE